MDDYGAIRRARRDGLSIREIARRFHHSRRKIRQVLAQAQPHPYARTQEQGHRTSICTGGKDLRHEGVVPAGRAAFDTQAGMLRPFLLHQIHRQPPPQSQVASRNGRRN